MGRTRTYLNNDHAKLGFTLVELSIVLVIIGLLIGGILAAQSMISTAKIGAQVRQIGQFDAMVSNFKSQYNYLPGDAPAFGGDGDGVLDLTAVQYPSNDNGATAFMCEIANFWHNLDPAQFPGSNPCVFQTHGIPALTSGPSKSAPSAKIGNSGSLFVALPITADGIYANLSLKQNYYVILGGSQLQSPVAQNGNDYNILPTNSSNSPATPVDALALDLKIDDGAANSGIVLSGAIGPSGYACCAAPTLSALATCSSGAAYQVQNSGYECTPLIRIGGSVGDPQ